MTQLFANNAYSVLASAALSTDTALTLAAGTGSRFPTPSGGDFFEATLIGYDTNGNENAWEVVKCTGRSGDSLTVVRAIDGSTAVAWASAARIEMRAAAGLFGRLAGKAAPGANSDITSLSALQSINGGPLAGMRNRIINGNFSVNQRAVSGTVTLVAGNYGHDRWKAGAGGCTYTFAASGNDTVITISAGSLLQVIEAKNVEGGTYAVSHAGTAQARIAVNGAATSGAYAIASQAAPLVSASATGGQAVTVEFSTGTVSKVMVEPGSVSSVYERRLNELELCQRYARPIPSFDYEFNGVTSMTNILNFSIPSMRTTPTVSFAPTFSILNNVSSPAAHGISPESMFITATVGSMGYARIAATGGLLTAEL